MLKNGISWVFHVLFYFEAIAMMNLQDCKSIEVA